MAADVAAVTAGIASMSATGAGTPVADENAEHVARYHMDHLEESKARPQVNNPASELYADTWDKMPIKEELKRGVRTEGWGAPAQIQASALPNILAPSRPSMIAQSKAGSGKTGAFGLAMLEVIDPKVAAPQALCLSPTRELAMQTLERLKKVGRFLVQSPDNPAGITSSVIMGGLRYERVTQHLLVATPGKLLELIKNRLIDLSALRIFTVDEADDMVVSFQSEVETIKKAASVKRAAGAPPHVQVLLFSASFDCIQPANPGAVKAKNFVDKLLDKPARTPTEIFIRSVEDLKLKNVTHFVAHVKPTGTRYDDAHEAKVAWIAEVYEFLTAGKSLIFSKDHKAVDRIAEALVAKGHKPSVGRGGRDKTTETRAATLDNFMRGVTKVLIATDSYARGIDVPDLKMMVNFELPVVFDPATKRYNPDRPDYATFQHRCGRVGRFEAVGVCVHLVASEQEARQLRGFLDHFHLAAHELPESALESTPTIESALKAPLPPPVGATSEAGAGAGAGSAAPASGGAGLPTAVAGNRLASAAFAAALPLDPGAKWGDAAVGK